MNETGKLLSVNVRGIFGINKALSGNPKEKNRARTRILLMLILFAFVGFSLFAMFYGMAVALDTMGDVSLLLSMAVVGASMLTLIDVIFRTTSVMFSFKDYDIVMSLPIKTASVVVSRIISMYIFELLFSLMIVIPALLAYAQFAATSVSFYVSFILMTITIPLIPMVLGMIPGTLIGMLAARTRRKNIASMISSLVFVAAYFYIVYYAFIASNDLTNLKPDAILSLGNSIQSIYPPSMWFANGINGSIADAALFILVGIAAIALVAYVLSVSFKKLHGIITAQKVSKSYSFRSIKRTTRFRALYKREWRRYLSSTPYVMNTAFGYIVLIALGVLAIVFKDAMTEFFALVSSEFLDRMYIGIAFLVAGFIACSTTSAITISLEGKQLWILQSLPTSAMSIFRTKMFFAAHLGVIASLITMFLIIIAFNPGIMMAVLMFLIPVLFAICYAVLGLFVNLLLPKFDWKTEMQVAKQSATVLIVNVVGMFIGMGIMILIIATTINAITLGLIVLGVIAAFTIGMLMHIRAKANAMMLKLSEK